jgi:uncharacterized protein involved in oxidation of intracellular sulfur
MARHDPQRDRVLVKHLFVLNDPPYGSERSYNGLRLALSLAKRDDTDVRVFLMGDAVGCAVAGQQTPDGYYNLERMLKGLAHKGVPVACCGTCLKARGIPDELLVPGATHSSLEELADWTLWAERVVSF